MAGGCAVQPPRIAMYMNLENRELTHPFIPPTKEAQNTQAGNSLPVLRIKIGEKIMIPGDHRRPVAVIPIMIIRLTPPTTIITQDLAILTAAVTLIPKITLPMTTGPAQGIVLGVIGNVAVHVPEIGVERKRNVLRPLPLE